MKKNILLFAILFALVSCEKSLSFDNLNPDDLILIDDFPKSVNFTSIAKGSLSGFETSGVHRHRELFRLREQWDGLLNCIENDNVSVNITDSFTETDIDFNEYFIISIFETSFNRLHSMEIIDVIETNENYTVSYRVATTASEGISRPYHIVKIPSSDQWKPIVYKKLGGQDPNDTNLTPIVNTEIGRGVGDCFELIPDSNMVITDENTWNELLGKISHRCPSIPGLPGSLIPVPLTQTTFDFNEYSLLVIFDIYHSNQNAIEMYDIVENDQNDVVVFYDGRNSSAAAALSQPFHIVKIPAVKPNQRVIFEKNLEHPYHIQTDYRFPKIH